MEPIKSNLISLSKTLVCLLPLYLILITGNTFSQDKVIWEISYNKLNSEIHFKAKIKKGWHLYAIYVPSPEDGPLPTSIQFHKKKGVTLKDSLVQHSPIIKYDKNFGLDLAYYEDTTTFRQPITINKNKGYLNGSIDYMTCNDNMCIPYHYPFEIKINRPN